MVRHYKRKTERGQAEEEQYKVAAKDVENGTSIREAARQHHLCAMSLSRYIKKAKKDVSFTPGYSKHKQVFTAVQELLLAKYIQESGERHFGLSIMEARKMAYQCAIKFGISHPPSWDNNKVAGEDWLLGFRQRHKLTLRVAENLSLARAIGFNKPSVERFFDNLLKVFSRISYGPESIYNVDETGVTTVPGSNRVLAKQGARSVGRIVSSEKGTLVTLVCAINAIGNSVPPMFIFPRKNFRDNFLNGAPPGSAGIANGSGWMKEDNFLDYLHHFARHAKPTADKPVLLVLDNHVSHMSIQAIDFCRDNNITLLSIPPHSSHKLQPLDRVIYGPFKTYVNNRSHAWMRENPGRSMTIYDIPSIVGDTLPRAMLQSKAIEAFRCTGIWPINRDIFIDSDFAASELTNRALPTSLPGKLTTKSTISTSPASPLPGPATNCVTRLSGPSISYSSVPLSPPGPSTSSALVSFSPPGPSTSSALVSFSPPGPSTSSALVSFSLPGPSTSPSSQLFSPHAVMAIPQAQRKETPKISRRKRKSEILTDSPVKNQLVAAKINTTKSNKKQTGKTLERTGGKKHEKIDSPDSEEQDFYCVICMEAYADSRAGEDWVKCQGCEQWAHDECTDIGARNFVFFCPKCH